MCDRSWIIRSVFNLRMFTVIPSNPGELLFFSEFIAFIIAWSLIKLNLFNKMSMIFEICSLASAYQL